MNLVLLQRLVQSFLRVDALPGKHVTRASQRDGADDLFTGLERALRRHEALIEVRHSDW